MPAEAFIDTNVVVYHLDDSEPEKSKIAHDIIRQAVGTGNACISFQVVQEFLNVVIGKARQPLSSADAHLYLTEVLAPLCQVFPTIALYQSAIDIQARYRFGFYDSLIVASALAAGCKYLLTEDLQDDQIVDGLRIRNPFA